MATFTKRAHKARIAFEYAGLEWLRNAPDGAPVVTVYEYRDGELDLEHINTDPVTKDAARAFGAALAHTHAAGAPHYGAGPDGWEGQSFMGRSELLLNNDPSLSWGEFYGSLRIMPYLKTAVDNRSLSLTDAAALETLCSKLSDGHYDHDEPQLVTKAARLHGDLWSGNVMWQHTGYKTDPIGILIDPAAHGGHAESDLAQLGVFGHSFLEEIYEGYNEVSPLADGYQERVSLHRLHILMVHAALFGGSYGAETMRAAAQWQ